MNKIFKATILTLTIMMSTNSVEANTLKFHINGYTENNQIHRSNINTDLNPFTDKNRIKEILKGIFDKNQQDNTPQDNTQQIKIDLFTEDAFLINYISNRNCKYFSKSKDLHIISALSDNAFKTQYSNNKDNEDKKGKYFDNKAEFIFVFVKRLLFVLSFDENKQKDLPEVIFFRNALEHFLNSDEYSIVNRCIQNLINKSTKDTSVKNDTNDSKINITKNFKTMQNILSRKYYKYTIKSVFQNISGKLKKFFQLLKLAR